MRILIIFFILFAPPAAWSQSPVYIDASQCRNITVDLVRVACYDRLADMVMQQNGTTPQLDQSRQPQQAQPQGSYQDQLREKNRQMREELARLRNSEPGGGDADRITRFGRPEQRIETNKDGEDILYDRIQSLQKGPDGWLITLASGQVWKELYNRPYNLEEGMEVKISPGMLGSYHLSSSKQKRFIYVKRIK